MPFARLPDWGSWWKSARQSLADHLVAAWDVRWMRQTLVALALLSGVSTINRAAALPGVGAVDGWLKAAFTADSDARIWLASARSWLGSLDLSSLRAGLDRIFGTELPTAGEAEVPGPDVFLLEWPIAGVDIQDGQLSGATVVATFGWRTTPDNQNTLEQGMTLAVPEGTSVLAAAPGVVSRVGSDSQFGNFVEIDHGNGLLTRYGYLGGASVAEGDRVKAGNPVGLSGATGRATAPSLYFELSAGGNPIDPAPYLGLIQGGS